MATESTQMAPGTLEIVRAFLNTWRIPNDTREPIDELVSLTAMHTFFSNWFEGLAWIHHACLFSEQTRCSSSV